MRENARHRADRLLLEGRVMLLEVGRYGVVAKVRGEGRVHTARYFGSWSCTCEARSDQCSHLHAVDLNGRGHR